MNIKNWQYKDEYYVTLYSSIGHFTGKCRLHKEDKKNPQVHFGYEIAETRAYIKYLKRLRSNYKQRLIGVETLCNRMRKPIDNICESEIKDLKYRIKEVSEEIVECQLFIENSIQNADKVRRNYERNKSNRSRAIKEFNKARDAAVAKLGNKE